MNTTQGSPCARRISFARGSYGSRGLVGASCMLLRIRRVDTEPFSSGVCSAGLQYLDGLGELPGAPGAAAQLQIRSTPCSGRDEFITTRMKCAQ
jgi:hypothetical protein